SVPRATDGRKLCRRWLRAHFRQAGIRRAESGITSVSPTLFETVAARGSAAPLSPTRGTANGQHSPTCLGHGRAGRLTRRSQPSRPADIRRSFRKEYPPVAIGALLEVPQRV